MNFLPVFSMVNSIWSASSSNVILDVSLNLWCQTK